MHTRRLHTEIIKTTVVLAFSLALVPDTHGAQTGEQRVCLTKLASAGRKVAKLAGKDVQHCFRDAGSAGLAPGVSAQACLGLDRKGRVAGAEKKVEKIEQQKCTTRPDFGYTDAENLGSAYRHGAIGVAIEMFGSDIDGAVQTDPFGRKCQERVSLHVTKLVDAALKVHDRCVRDGLESGDIDTRNELAACVSAIDADPKGKIEKALGRLEKDLAGICAPVDLQTAFPGACSSSSDPVDCLGERVRCQVCKMVTQANDVAPDCDTFDDGTVNGTCDTSYPQVFANLLVLPTRGEIYYVGGPGLGSNDYDGSSPVPLGGGVGPWEDFQPLASATSVACPGRGNVSNGTILCPGDEVVMRGAVYDHASGTSTIDVSGAPTEPIRFSAYPGETPVFQGPRAPGEDPDPANGDPVLRMAGAFTIVDGLKITGCDVTCMNMKDGTRHSILMNSTIEGGAEDGIKASHMRLALLLRNDFTAFLNEAIDHWGSQHTWLVENTFHDNDTSIPEIKPSTAVWTKGGSVNVHLARNVFEDLTVGAHALNLGGCCWTNWKDEGGLVQQGGSWVPQPVARQVRARDNVFTNIATDEAVPNPYAAALGVEGCFDCEATGSVMSNVEEAIGVHPTYDRCAPKNPEVSCTKSGIECDLDVDNCAQYEVFPQNVSITGTTIVGIPHSIGASRITTIKDVPTTWADYAIEIDHNDVCVAELPAEFRIVGRQPDIFTPAQWIDEGFDTSSTLTQHPSCTG